MPKRTNRQIREDTFAALQANGRLETPLYKKPRPVRKLKIKDKEPYCCFDRYGENLPQRFRPCADCPKQIEETVTAVT